MYRIIIIALFAAIAFGVNWTAYESHIANNGVLAMTNAISGQRMPSSVVPPDDSWKWHQPSVNEQHKGEGYSF